MPRKIFATFSLEPGASYPAVVANLSRTSLFLRTDRLLSFREPITVTFSGVTLRGEVAFACDHPPGALVVFEPVEHARAVLERLAEEAEVIASARAIDRNATWEAPTVLVPSALASDLVLEQGAVRPKGHTPPAGSPLSTTVAPRAPSIVDVEIEISSGFDLEPISESKPYLRPGPALEMSPDRFSTTDGAILDAFQLDDATPAGERLSSDLADGPFTNPDAPSPLARSLLPDDEGDTEARPAPAELRDMLDDPRPPPPPRRRPKSPDRHVISTGVVRRRPKE